MLKKITAIIIDELKKGATPEKLSQGLVIGFLIGIFPLLGFTTLMAAVIGYFFRLNQVVVQTTHYLMYPIQMIMIPVYIKIVGMIFNVGFVPVRPDILLTLFKADPKEFLQKYALVGAYAVGLWCILSAVIYLVMYPVTLKAVLKFKNRRNE